jgi:hypothetical protein
MVAIRPPLRSFRGLRAFTWLALVAALALALLPTLSHAVAHARGGSAWAEVCTAQGARLVAVVDAEGGDGAAAPLQGMIHLEHCPFCALSAGAVGLPPAQPAPLALPLGSDAPPARFLSAPRTLFAWAAAQPRGPPSIA